MGSKVPATPCRGALKLCLVHLAQVGNIEAVGVCKTWRPAKLATGGFADSPTSNLSSSCGTKRHVCSHRGSQNIFWQVQLQHYSFSGRIDATYRRALYIAYTVTLAGSRLPPYTRLSLDKNARNLFRITITTFPEMFWKK